MNALESNMVQEDEQKEEPEIVKSILEVEEGDSCQSGLEMSGGTLTIENGPETAPPRKKKANK